MGGVAKMGRDSQVVATGEENGAAHFLQVQCSRSVLPSQGCLLWSCLQGAGPQVSPLPPPGECDGPALEMDVPGFHLRRRNKLVNIVPPHRPSGTISRSPAPAGIRQARHLA